MNDFNSIIDKLPVTRKFPVMFLGHGNPMNAIENNEFTRGFRMVSGTFGRPAAILCISAHWETNGTFVTSLERPKTIHDFYGFPEELYSVEYNAPGSPLLASETIKSIQSRSVLPDESWGLDHGAWSVLKHLYPEADIPVIELSLNYNLTPEEHYAMARELAPLREKGVLIIGSGNMIHNLRMLAWDKMYLPDFSFDWALLAGEKMKRMIIEDDHRSLIEFRKQGREFNLSIPTPEHFLPLLYILALKDKNERVTLFNDKNVAGSLSMTSLITSADSISS
jgi:4,5-DOPA dioxygenase extradiol